VKRLLPLLVIVLALGAMPSITRASEKAPALNIEGALKLAQDYLKGASPSDPRSIVALTLERPTMTGAPYWYARWSSPILGASKAEIGLRIEMTGALTKVMAGGGGGGGGSGVAWGGGGPSVPVPGLGSQKYGVRDMH
jgi:hypothetical protein